MCVVEQLDGGISRLKTELMQDRKCIKFLMVAKNYEQARHTHTHTHTHGTPQ